MIATEYSLKFLAGCLNESRGCRRNRCRLTMDDQGGLMCLIDRICVPIDVDTNDQGKWLRSWFDSARHSVRTSRLICFHVLKPCVSEPRGYGVSAGYVSQKTVS